MIITLVILAAFALGVYAFLQTSRFGKLPEGKRLAQIEQAPNYRNGSFQNLSHTPDLTEGVGYWEVIKEFIFERKPNLSPAKVLPSVKTDLLALPASQNALVWFGHSSYFMQVDGMKFLVDPVFSGSASPLPFGAKAYSGSDFYGVEDTPEIDVLLITHDHWDHLDYETVIALKTKVKKVICGLGVGVHLEHWGYDPEVIIEKNWNEQLSIGEGFILHTLPARHFSGRGLKRNQSLWLSFALKTPTANIYIGGDSGYDTHFKKIGEQFGPFDLAILENGQYDRKWRYIHMLPDELPKAAADLNTRSLFPVHSGKFTLSNHPWNEPLELITKNLEGTGIKLITPMIGEAVFLDQPGQNFTTWWRGVD